MVSVESYGDHTSYFRLPSSVQDSPLLLFLPGNPGLVEYYTEYLSLVHSKFPHFEILCVSHAGFNTTGPASESVYSLQSQIDHKLEILRLESRNTVKRDLVVFGHSVGSWIAQRVILGIIDDEELSARYVPVFVGLITPTITDIACSSSGKILSLLSGYIPLPRVLSLASAGLRRFVPQHALESLLAWKLGSSGEPVRATFNLVTSSNIVKQALAMAIEEMHTIKGDQAVNERFFKLNMVKWAYFADGDHWVADQTRQGLIERYSDSMQYELGEKGGIVHSFCVSQSEQFAEITNKALGKYGLGTES